jgi:hypothetical protein
MVVLFMAGFMADRGLTVWQTIDLKRKMVPGLGIEPRTRGFSILCSTD